MCWNYRQWRYLRRRQSMDEQVDFSGDLPFINIDGKGDSNARGRIARSNPQNGGNVRTHIKTRN